MKMSSQVIGLPLIGVKEGQECGAVKDVVVDPQSKKVKSLVLQGTKSEYDYLEVKIGDIIGIGKDYAITQSIANATCIGSAETGMTLQKVKCIASSGDVLGNIKDFSFEEKTGDILSIAIDTGIEIKRENILSLSNNLLFANSDQSGIQMEPPSSLEKEQHDYMLGRIVKNDVKAADGTVVVKKGTLVTEDTIRQAQESGVMIDLTLEL